MQAKRQGYTDMGPQLENRLLQVLVEVFFLKIDLGRRKDCVYQNLNK